jgi:energy-coupling factor transport system substrate-specific component
MGIAIITTGLLTDLTTFIISRGYKNELVILISAASYAVYSFITSIYITNVVSGNMIFDIVSLEAFVIVGIIVFILGYIGAKIGQMIYNRIGLRK